MIAGVILKQVTQEVVGITTVMLTFHLLQHRSLTSAPVSCVRDLRVDETKLRNYLQKIEAGYDSSNPYHNRLPSAMRNSSAASLTCTGLKLAVQGLWLAETPAALLMSLVSLSTSLLPSQVLRN